MKKYLIPVIAVVFAVGSAFTFKPQAYTFRFDGSTTVASERTSPAKYTLTNPGCSGTEANLCTIEAMKDANDKPVISGTLLSDLNNNGSSVGPIFTSSEVTGKNP